jgi:DNA ligase (NAD+)
VEDSFSVPSFCPTCGANTEEAGCFLICPNRSCSARSSGSIRVWVNKLGILNWGDALIDSLTTGGTPKVQSVPDLYRLSIEDIAGHCSGMKHARKCYDSLHSQKDITLDLVLSALNITNLGLSTATDIINNGYDSIELISKLTEDGLIKVPNIGPKLAKDLYEGILDKIEVLKDLKTVLNIKPRVEGSLSNVSICITGNTTIPRKTLQKRIIDNGGTVKETVVSGLTYLVTNEDLSSFTSDKVKKANKYKVNIIKESDLLVMMRT